MIAHGGCEYVTILRLIHRCLALVYNNDEVSLLYLENKDRLFIVRANKDNSFHRVHHQVIFARSLCYSVRKRLIFNGQCKMYTFV